MRSHRLKLLFLQLVVQTKFGELQQVLLWQLVQIFLQLLQLFREQVFYVIATAHTRGCDLFVEQAVRHRRNTDSCRGASVFAEEERLSAAFGTRLLCRSRQSQRRFGRRARE